MKLDSVRILLSNTILEAMQKIELNKKRFLIIIDADQVAGTITDGDIRRYLIRGNDIPPPFVKTIF